jgi:hypothetical protein
LRDRVKNRRAFFGRCLFQKNEARRGGNGLTPVSEGEGRTDPSSGPLCRQVVRAVPPLGGLPAMTYPMPHVGKQSLFAVLSLADLALTTWLLTRPGGRAYEANPVANWWLTRHGWLGLAGFKVAVVLFVGLLAAFISRFRPRGGRLVLNFGCAAVSLVVLYSACLCGRLPSSSSDEVAADGLVEINRKARDVARVGGDYRALLGRLIEDLIAGRRSLSEAAAKLADTERGRDPVWMKGLTSSYPGHSPQQCLAATIILHAVVSQEDPRAARRLLHRLEQEFRRTYGVAAPPCPAEILRGTPAPDDEEGGDPGRVVAIPFVSAAEL